MRYTLILTAGKVITEQGHFFPALPFTIHCPAPINATLNVRFERGTNNKVVYKIFHDQKLLAECPYPEYVPETAPGSIQLPATLSAPLRYAMGVFAYLKLLKTPAYLETLHPKISALSFKVIQLNWSPAPATA